MTTDLAAGRPRHVILARRLGTAAALTLIGVLGGPPGAAAVAPGWLAPLDPLVVVHGFDQPAGPYAPGHRGVDLAGSPGQPVRVAASGVVSYAGQVAGVGVVAVVHGRIRTTYQPLEVGTTRGAAVDAGDEIGRLVVASSHCSPDPCLHWGAIVGDTYVDPLQLMHPGPSRLLPYWDISRQPAAGIPLPVGATLPAPGLVPAAGTAGRMASADDPTGGRPVAAAPTGTVARADERAGPTSTAQQPSALPAGGVLAVAVLGGVVAGATLLAVRRRRR